MTDTPRQFTAEEFEDARRLLDGKELHLSGPPLQARKVSLGLMLQHAADLAREFGRVEDVPKGPTSDNSVHTAPSDSANSQTPETDLIVTMLIQALRNHARDVASPDGTNASDLCRDLREAADALTRLREEIARFHALCVK